MTLSVPVVVFATPRKLPKAQKLDGRVAVLDIAFAACGTGASFEKVTEPFLRALGERLVAWVDHHDHERHSQFASDPRFVLAKKSDHGACPEMITPEVVARAGRVDTLVCHDDLDGLYSAAKWLRGGIEPYAGADADARAADTRMGDLSPLAQTIDHALRAHPKDEALRHTVVQFLTAGAVDEQKRQVIDEAALRFRQQEDNAHLLARRYRMHGRAAVVDATGFKQQVGPYDKTLVLLLGQQQARVAVLYDEDTVTLAAPFDSGVDLLALLGIDGGMPTRVSVPRKRLDEVLTALDKI